MSTEMKKLIIGGTEYEIVDESGRSRISALEQGGGGSGTGLTQTEKNLLLTLLEKAAYAENDAGTAYTALSDLWAGYSITWSGTGYTKSNGAASVESGGTFTSTVTANTGFTITNVTATMGGNTVQGAWSNGTVTIPNVTGDIVITVTTSQMTVSSISAVYTQSGTVYDTDSLDSLKSDLVVTATFMDSSTGVIDATDYTLSGTLTEGTSEITVSYAGKTATVYVTVTHYTIPALYNWDFTQSLTDSVGGVTAQIANVTQESDGLHMSATNSVILLGDVFPINRTLEINFASTSASLSGQHGRLVMFNDTSNPSTATGVGNGFIYRSTGKWAVYKGGWAESTETNADIFSGKKLVMKYYLGNDSQYHTDVYVDSTLIMEFSSTTKWNTTGINPVQLGSSGNTFKDAVISGIRIYEGV